jgi:hypothetical protein
MTVFIHTNKDGLQTWLADFLSSNIAVSARRPRLTALSDHQPEKQMHSNARSHRKSIKASEIGNRSAHLS